MAAVEIDNLLTAVSSAFGVWIVAALLATALVRRRLDSSGQLTAHATRRGRTLISEDVVRRRYGEHLFLLAALTFVLVLAALSI